MGTRVKNSLTDEYGTIDRYVTETVYIKYDGCPTPNAYAANLVVSGYFILIVEGEPRMDPKLCTRPVPETDKTLRDERPSRNIEGGQFLVGHVLRRTKWLEDVPMAKGALVVVTEINPENPRLMHVQYPGDAAPLMGWFHSANFEQVVDIHPAQGPTTPSSPVLDTNPKTLVGRVKPDLSLIPAVSMAHTADAFMDGAQKYGPYNWREKTVSLRTYIAAAQRHMGLFLDGETVAEDSQVHHLGHVMACCAIMLDAISVGNAIDDRPLPGKSGEVIEAIRSRRAKEHTA